MLLLALVASEPINMLTLAGAPLGAGVPPGWKVRVVRGQNAPETEVRIDGEGAVLRVHGAGRAAWFYREIAPAFAESMGTLRWNVRQWGTGRLLTPELRLRQAARYSGGRGR